MKAIFYILSILVIGASAYFAYDNKSKLEAEIAMYNDLSAERAKVNADTKDTENSLEDTKGALSDAKDRKSVLESQKGNEEAKERSLNATLEKIETRIEEADAKLKQFEEVQKEVAKALEGIEVPFNQIESKIEELENDRKEQQKKLDELTVLEEKLSDSVTGNREEIARLVARIDEIRQKMDLNSVVGAVTAVDPVWGFVIVNLGEKNSNITPESELLVSRSGSLLCRLTVSSIEPNRTICDLDLKSVRPGQRVQPGDKVILAKTVGN